MTLYSIRFTSHNLFNLFGSYFLIHYHFTHLVKCIFIFCVATIDTITLNSFRDTRYLPAFKRGRSGCLVSVTYLMCIRMIIIFIRRRIQVVVIVVLVIHITQCICQMIIYSATVFRGVIYQIRIYIFEKYYKRFRLGIYNYFENFVKLVLLSVPLSILLGSYSQLVLK